MLAVAAPIIYLLDTSLLIAAGRNNLFWAYVQQAFDLWNHDKLTSIVNVAEVESFALQNTWEEPSLSRLSTLLSVSTILPIQERADTLAFARIDAYTTKAGRRMTKNDL